MSSPFFELVMQLRAAGLRLDINTVKSVVQALDSGRGLEMTYHSRSVLRALGSFCARTADL